VKAILDSKKKCFVESFLLENIKEGNNPVDKMFFLKKVRQNH
jgi:hypothetical protein